MTRTGLRSITVNLAVSVMNALPQLPVPQEREEVDLMAQWIINRANDPILVPLPAVKSRRSQSGERGLT
jgi:hypothetical protein